MSIYYNLKTKTAIQCEKNEILTITPELKAIIDKAVCELPECSEEFKPVGITLKEDGTRYALYSCE